MKSLQHNVLEVKAMQVLGGLTQTLIWGSETAKGPT